MTSDYLNDLNEAQREAVINVAGPSLVIAGAGAERQGYLLSECSASSERVRANKILALTFTNKAAREMKDRITNIAGMK